MTDRNDRKWVVVHCCISIAVIVAAVALSYWWETHRIKLWVEELRRQGVTVNGIKLEVPK